MDHLRWSPIYTDAMRASLFARVLLAPDPLIVAYRRQGKDLRGFAETFLIPTRVAQQRWDDSLFD